MHSLNVATVKVAEMIGYQRVVQLARQMGLGTNIQATPAVALGAYEMTPIEVAAGYTAFASNGVRAEPLFIRACRGGRWDHRRTAATDDAAGARPARRISHDEPHGRRHRPRHGLSRARHGFHRSGCGEDRNVARRLVRRIYVESPLRRVGRLRRQSRPRHDRRPVRGADLGRIHETSGAVADVQQHAAISTAGGHRPGHDRPAVGAARHGFVPADRGRILHRGNRADAVLPAPRRPAGATPGGSWLAHLFGKGDNPPQPQAPGSNAAAPGAKPGPGQAQAQNPADSPASQQADQDDKKKSLLDKIFGIFGGSKQPADGSKPPQ